MENRTRHLKIKIQSLVDESKNIRREAKKVSGLEKYDLNSHRTRVVRPVTRVNLLAYGLLRHVPYSVMERKTDLEEWQIAVLFRDVEKTARKFGATDEMVDAWMKDAKMYLDPKKNAA